ncbi:pentapeptide repeat-containing protein [Nonomuraea jabiensis]|uniref:pentapeptide repeat-containing protein n=1 Tax=Nonomuraea jabiensis TaxID=882448 RepID=UPI003D7414B6
MGFFGATFEGDAWFEKAAFTDTASFSGASFTGAAWFEQTTASNGARFDGATSTGMTIFEDIRGAHLNLAEAHVVHPYGTHE